MGHENVPFLTQTLLCVQGNSNLDQGSTLWLYTGPCHSNYRPILFFWAVTFYEKLIVPPVGNKNNGITEFNFQLVDTVIPILTGWLTTLRKLVYYSNLLDHWDHHKRHLHLFDYSWNQGQETSVQSAYISNLDNFHIQGILPAFEQKCHWRPHFSPHSYFRLSSQVWSSQRPGHVSRREYLFTSLVNSFRTTRTKLSWILTIWFLMDEQCSHFSWPLISGQQLVVMQFWPFLCTWPSDIRCSTW